MNAKVATWTGRVLSGVAALFMLLDAVGHLVNPAPVVEAFARVGFPDTLSFGIGVLALVCTAVYAIPRTAVVGAILLTGYLGGATAIQVRAGSPAFETIFPCLIGVLLWAGLFLRFSKLRALIPLQR